MFDRIVFDTTVYDVSRMRENCLTLRLCALAPVAQRLNHACKP